MKLKLFDQFMNEAVAVPAAPVIPVVAPGNTPARDQVVKDCLSNIYLAMYREMSTFVDTAKQYPFANSIIPTEEEWYLAQKKFVAETSNLINNINSNKPN